MGIESSRCTTGRGEGLPRVFLRDGKSVFSLTLFPRIGSDGLGLGLCIAYVMYNAKERIESAERVLVSIDLNVSRKYPNVCAVNASPLSASSHFLIMP